MIPDWNDHREWQMVEDAMEVRRDLAAAYQIADRHGFNEGIHNHFTLMVPSSTDRFLVIPYGLHWSEVTASSLLTVGFDGTILSGQGEVEASAISIHGPIHRLVPRATCILHTHMPFASALTRIDGFRIEATGQTEIGLRDEIAYDSLYTGIAYDIEEGERLAVVLGSKSILFMSNHGVLVVGKTIAEAYNRLYYLERACRVQLFALWTGMPLKKVPEPIVMKTIAQFANSPSRGHGKNMGSAELHFAALKRLIERKEPPNYRK
jgi:ribulose-5-phosphate 4-epimerase/fuculose-1-phosphate aldolase